MRIHRRPQRGASMIALITLVAFFVVLPLSLVGFEMGRYFLLLTQVQNVAAACALSGTGAIATIPSTAASGSALQNLYNGCAQEAIYCLQLNSLLGNQMRGNVSNVYNNQYAPYTPPPNPGIGKAAISISFVNLDGTWHQDLTQPGAVRMAVTIAYTTTPVFSTPGLILSLMPTITAVASSTGGLPQLDVFLCFDISGSMDDQTGVCYVNRYWDVVNNHVAYDFNANQGGVPNTLYYQCPNITYVGTAMNVCPPQNLSQRDQATYFNQPMRCDATVASEAGALPGGVTLIAGVPTPHSLAYTGIGTVQPTLGAGIPNPLWNNPYGIYPSFTDLVVMPNANPAGVTAAYMAPANWQQLAVVECEQSRGNLTSKAVFEQSEGGASYAGNNPYHTALYTAANAGQTPQQYWAFAAQNATPISQALTAGQNFVNTMNLSTDARFGLCCFSSTAGATAPNNKYPATAGSPDQYIISDNTSASYPDYVPGGKAGGNQFPLPWVSVGEGTPTSFTKAVAALAPPTSSYDPKSAGNTQITPLLQTNMGAAFQAGATDIITNGRATASRAVVIFTDGIPTTSIPGNNDSDLTSIATTLANNTPAIPVYTIGLAQGGNATLMTKESTLLSAISAAGAPGGKYFGTQSATDLNTAFQSIARSLVLLRSAN